MSNTSRRLEALEQVTARAARPYSRSEFAGRPNYYNILDVVAQLPGLLELWDVLPPLSREDRQALVEGKPGKVSEAGSALFQFIAPEDLPVELLALWDFQLQYGDDGFDPFYWFRRAKGCAVYLIRESRGLPPVSMALTRDELEQVRTYGPDLFELWAQLSHSRWQDYAMLEGWSLAQLPAALIARCKEILARLERREPMAVDAPQSTQHIHPAIDLELMPGVHELEPA